MKSAKITRSSVLILGLIGSVVIACGLFAGGSSAAQAGISGAASLSGTVDSTTPFKAAQVFIRNVDKRILYMVYTNAGQFRAVPLFPGNYEVSARVGTRQSDVQKVVVKAGDNPKLMLSLHDPVASSQRTIVSGLESENSSDSQ